MRMPLHYAQTHLCVPIRFPNKIGYKRQQEQYQYTYLKLYFFINKICKPVQDINFDVNVEINLTPG